MKTIVVDDEPIMLRSFTRLSKGIDGLDGAELFEDPEEALAYAEKTRVDLAILDISMPHITGIELAQKLRARRPEMLIVFITAYDEYIRESNTLGADDYIVKPYQRETLLRMAERMRLLAKRLETRVTIHTFGAFTVLHNGTPVPLTGKAKEILALVVARHGREISNEEIYNTVWENRPYGNEEMKVYYNALHRLRRILREAGISELLLSTTRGQMLNTAMVDCDYYHLLEGDGQEMEKFTGEFMTEYAWGESVLGGLAGTAK